MISPKRAVAITGIVCLTTVVSHSIGRSIYGLLLPAIEDDLDLTHSQAGLPSSGIFVLYVVGVLAVVFASPRVEPITIMRTAFVVSVVGLVVVATANGLVALTLGVSLVGGAGAGIWMTAPVLATEYVSERRRGLVIGALTSTIGLANVSLGVGTRALRRSSNNDLLWRPIWWIALVFTAGLLIALVTVVRFSPTDRIRTNGIDLGILKRVPHWRQVTVAYAIFGGMSAGFGAFIVAALEEHGGLSRSSSAVVFSLMGVSGMIAAPLTGALSDRLGRLIMMRVALASLVLANACVAIGGQWPVMAGAIIYGAGASSFPALIATYVRDSLDNRSFSQALAIMTILFSIVAAILPTVVGAVADATDSFQWPYLLIAVLPAISLGLLSTVTTTNTAS